MQVVSHLDSTSRVPPGTPLGVAQRCQACLIQLHNSVAQDINRMQHTSRLFPAGTISLVSSFRSSAAISSWCPIRSQMSQNQIWVHSLMCCCAVLAMAVGLSLSLDINCVPFSISKEAQYSIFQAPPKLCILKQMYAKQQVMPEGQHSSSVPVLPAGGKLDHHCRSWLARYQPSAPLPG